MFNEVCESSVNHRIADCPKAVQAWLKLNEARLELGFDALTDFSYETILGVKQKLSKVELALNAELLHRLTTFGGNDYCPNQMVKAVIRMIGNCEPLDLEIRNRFKEMIREG